MKTLKRCLALLSALLMLPALGGCGEPPEEPEVYEVARESISTTYTYFFSDDEPWTEIHRGVTEYDERGLATKLAANLFDDVNTVALDYSFNEQGDPESFSFLFAGQEFRVLLENRYEEGQLREAVITELQLEGEPLELAAEPDFPWGEMHRLMFAGAAKSDSYWGEVLHRVFEGVLFPALEHYVGYRDCCLRLEGTEQQIRWEGGRQVYVCRTENNRILYETEITRTEDGGDLSTQWTRPLVENVTIQTSGITREIDGQHYLRRVVLYYPDGSQIELRFRLEDGGLNEEGEALRLAYADEIRAEGRGKAEELAARLEEYRELPFAEYTLREDGRVRSCLLRNHLLNAVFEENYLSEARIWYDEQDRQLRRETLIDTDTARLLSVEEREYR